MSPATKKVFGRLAASGSALLAGAAFALLSTSDAFAFSLGSDGSITVYRDSNENPEGKSDVGREFWTTFNGSVNRTELEGLQAQALFKVDSFDTNGKITLSGMLFAGPNTGLFQNYRVSVLGFAVDPDAINASVSGVFNTTQFGAITANGGIATELCFKDGGGPNCNGGGSGGVSLGQTGNFTISFTLSDPTRSSFTLSDFGVRYQSIDSTYYNIRGGSGTGTGQAVPEPFTILGTAAALGFSGLYQRERSKRKSKETVKA